MLTHSQSHINAYNFIGVSAVGSKSMPMYSTSRQSSPLRQIRSQENRVVREKGSEGRNFLA